MKQVKLHLGYAGHCVASEHHAIQGGQRRPIQFDALWGLIQHPERGYILYDTGYTQRFFQETRRFPAKIYALATPVSISPEAEVRACLSRYGIKPEMIRYLILTHFHADHAGGLRDFPNAQIFVSRAALDQVLRTPKTFAFAKGILPGLLPEDLAARVVIIEDHCAEKPDQFFEVHYDLFGDGAIQVLPLPGHAAGQIGARLQTKRHTYLLAADACWLCESYQENRLPSPIVRLFFDSWRDFKRSLSRLHHYHLAHPEVRIVPTHCRKSTAPLVQENVQLDVL